VPSRNLSARACTLSDMSTVTVVGVLLALAAGLAIGWLVASAGSRSIEGRLSAERDAAREQVARLAAELPAVVERARAAERDATLLGERLAVAERQGTEMSERFKLLSQEVLDRTSERMLALTDERIRHSEQQAKSALDQRALAVEQLIKPLSDSLELVRNQVQEVEKTRAGAYAELREQVGAMKLTSEQLRTETSQLVTALRAPQVRGRWGETQLRQVVEFAGMVEHCDFVEQPTVTTADGSRRPDLIIRLAGDKHVVVDAKVAFSGYLEAMEARDEATRAARLKAHARHFKDHIDSLAAKAYWEQFQPSPEFVVMFVPAESFLSAALEQEPGLFEHAFEQNVVLATPQTLIALLRTVAYSWRQEALADNAKLVYQLGRELHSRLATMGGHLTKLGNGLGGAVKAYNEAIASMESRVLVTARKLTDLKVTDDHLAAPVQLEVAPRQIQAAELVASATESLVALETTRERPQPDEIEADPRYGVDPDAGTTGDSAPGPRSVRADRKGL
jgi:DNA recombination protein RmuC